MIRNILPLQAYWRGYRIRKSFFKRKELLVKHEKLKKNRRGKWSSRMEKKKVKNYFFDFISLSLFLLILGSRRSCINWTLWRWAGEERYTRKLWEGFGTREIHRWNSKRGWNPETGGFCEVSYKIALLYILHEFVKMNITTFNISIFYFTNLTFIIKPVLFLVEYGV